MDEVRIAANYARNLTPIITKEKEEEIRNRIARDFFAGGDLPDDLKRGWAVLEQLRKHRQEIQYPLPPGGCFLLGRESVIAGCMAEMHTALSKMLRISPENIKIRLERDEAGHIQPVADIETPGDWIMPVKAHGDKSAEEMTRDYLERFTKIASQWFKETVSQRLSVCEDRREELMQEVVPWSGNAREKEQHR